MAWDQRGYFYENVRIDGKVVRRYYGKGPLAELAAQQVALRKEARQRDAAQAKAAVVFSGAGIEARRTADLQHVFFCA